MTSSKPAERSLPQLTKKQSEVLALVADNRTSKEIAALLGISESAVNQRIEIVRGRLGGLPRGELARLYRLNFSTGEDPDGQNWQNIHLSNSSALSKGGEAESIRVAIAEGSQGFGDVATDGSQLSAIFPSPEPPWLLSEQRSMVTARAAIIGLIVATALIVAVLVTRLVGPGIG